MQITSSYGVEIKKQNIPIRHTLRIYRSAVSYLIQVYAESWEELSQLDNIQKRFNAAEHLVHETKKNRAKYDFDLRFPRLPSYLRRSAIQHALGSVSSYETRLGLWERGKLTGKPKLVCENHAMPVFYRDVMYKAADEQEDAAYLKLYDGRDWKWFRVNLFHTDMEYLRKNWAGKKASAPTLEKRHHRYFLRFSYTEEIAMPKTDAKNRRSAAWIWESIRMRSVPFCGQTELSWDESLSTFPVIKTGCTMYWAESADFRENTVRGRFRAAGLTRSV